MTTANNMENKQNNEIIIKVEDLTVAYEDKPVLWDVELNVKKGVLMAIVAYVPQRGSVDWDFPTTVFDVVEMGRYGKVGWLKRVSKIDKEKTKEAIAKVGMEEFSDRQISQLSGGQQQRVFLARALVQEAEIYFMDEPFQGVDSKTEKSIIDILKKLRNEGKTVIAVHHDLQTVKEYFDYVTFINVAVIASGHVDDVFTEANIEKAYKNKTHSISIGQSLEKENREMKKEE